MAVEMDWGRTLKPVGEFNTAVISTAPDRSSRTWVFVFRSNRYICGVLRQRLSTVVDGKVPKAPSMGFFKELVDISSNISIFLSTEIPGKYSEEKERGSLHIVKHPSGSSG